MKKHVIAMALLLLIAVFGLPAAADWNFNGNFDGLGARLVTNSTGTVYGGVYVGVGDKDAMTRTSTDGNHTSNYTLPDPTLFDDLDVKWARLYVDAWGENEFNCGWVNMTFNGVPQSRWYGSGGDGRLDNHPDNFGSGHGVVWVRFNVTNDVVDGTNRVDVTSTIGGNGDVYRAVLVCAYNDTDGCGHLVNYWVNDGNVNLHYDAGAGSNDDTTTWFNGTAYNATDCPKVCCAKLTTVYHSSGGGVGGNMPEPDYLYFNVIPTTTDHSPYYHRPNQLGDDGDTTYGDDDYADTAPYWTLKSEGVKPLLNATNNNATFWRGYNASNGAIYHSSTYTDPTGAEGEAFLHPMLAVLTVRTTKHYAEMNMVGGGVDNFFGLPMMDSQSVSTAVSSLTFPNPGYVQRYNSTTMALESCYLWNGQALPSSQFTMLDPVRGYTAKPSVGTGPLTWTSE